MFFSQLNPVDDSHQSVYFISINSIETIHPIAKPFQSTSSLDTLSIQAEVKDLPQPPQLAGRKVSATYTLGVFSVAIESQM
jgi:hypothetical protein